MKLEISAAVEKSEGITFNKDTNSIIDGDGKVIKTFQEPVKRRLSEFLDDDLEDISKPPRGPRAPAKRRKRVGHRKGAANPGAESSTSPAVVTPTERTPEPSTSASRYHPTEDGDHFTGQNEFSTGQNEVQTPAQDTSDGDSSALDD